MKALVLSGGAARGAYEAGVVCALAQSEQFDIVCGSSIGALNGHLVAQGRFDLLRALWRDVTPLRLLRVSPGELLRFRGVFSHAPVRQLVQKYADLATLQLTYIAAVTNLTLGIAESFFAFPVAAKAAEAGYREAEPNARPLTPENLVDAICASASVPPAFSPVSIAVDDGRTYAYGDACIANNSPIRQAIDAGADEVTVVFMQHSDLRQKPLRVRSIVDVTFASQDIVSQRVLELDLKLARAVNENVRLGAAPGKRFVDIRVIGPSAPLRLSPMRFDDQAVIDRAFDQGLADGTEAARLSAQFREESIGV